MICKSNDLSTDLPKDTYVTSSIDIEVIRTALIFFFFFFFMKKIIKHLKHK